VDLRTHAAKASDPRKMSLRDLHAEALKPTPTVEEIEAEEEDGEVVERVMIRSLDEKVAVGGKNFSQFTGSTDALHSSTTVDIS
jgi:hypothetical protein